LARITLSEGDAQAGFMNAEHWMPWPRPSGLVQSVRMDSQTVSAALRGTQSQHPHVEIWSQPPLAVQRNTKPRASRILDGNDTIPASVLRSLEVKV
jgi:hypothetical protein